MSIDLWPVRVFYESNRGAVKVGQVTRELVMPPTIPGLPRLEGIDYTRGLPHPELQPLREGKREMTQTEINFVLAWLDRVEKGLA